MLLGMGCIIICRHKNMKNMTMMPTKGSLFNNQLEHLSMHHVATPYFSLAFVLLLFFSYSHFIPFLSFPFLTLRLKHG
jgi:ABC-type dipeptide/oligopeptide/nickel transport system permease component